MGTAPTSKGSPREPQTQWGLTLFTLLLLLVVEQTNSQDYYDSGNRLIRDIKDIKASIKEIEKEIQFIKDFSNIPTQEDHFANLGCPDYFTPLNTAFECILIARQYSTYKEATDSCASIGAHLAVPKDVKLLTDFLNERESSLSDDEFWIGADNNSSPMLRWVDGRPVEAHRSLFHSYFWRSRMTDLNQTYNLCGTLKLDRSCSSCEDKVVSRKCDDPKRRPYICEIDPGSESIKLESPSFNLICPEGFIPLPTGECIYISSIDESQNYSKAGNFCAAQGSELTHPRNLTALISTLTEFLSQNLEDNSYNQQFQEFWLNESFLYLDQDLCDMMEQSKQQGDGEAGLDMCALLKTRPSKLEIYKDIASCSSSQRFICHLSISRRAHEMLIDHSMAQAKEEGFVILSPCDGTV